MYWVSLSLHVTVKQERKKKKKNAVRKKRNRCVDR